MANCLSESFINSKVQNTREVAFFDDSLDDLDALISGLRPGVRPYLFANTSHGVAAITEHLLTLRDIDVLHLVTHGAPGELYLGRDELTAKTLLLHAPMLARWADVLSSDATLFVYGCQAAAGRSGEFLVEQLSNLTGAHVIASSNIVGHPDVGGNWVFDYGHSIGTTPMAFEQSVTRNYMNAFATITGSSSDDNLFGTAGNDLVLGLAGDDILSGEEGNDTLDGGSGLDMVDNLYAIASVTVNLQNGTATDGYGGTDTLISIENAFGSEFNDTLTGDDGDNFLYGWNGNDRLTGNGGADTLTGDIGNDTIDGGAGLDFISFQPDPDPININLQNSSVTDGFGYTDTFSNIEGVIGSNYNDTITGTNADNILQGWSGNDSISGLGGNDTLLGDAGDDTLDGGTGTDAVAYLFNSQGIAIDLGFGTATDNSTTNDTLISIEHAGGTGYDDYIEGDLGPNRLRGFSGDDSLLGSDGNDTLIGDAGGDELKGGSGFDYISYEDDPGAINVSLKFAVYPQVVVATDGYGHDDLIQDIEGVIGSAFNDTIVGGNTANNLQGGSGNDHLSGLSGNDTFIGAGGNDTFLGGLGADSFDGGSGWDYGDYSNLTSGITVDMSSPGSSTGEASGDTFTGMEGLIGTGFNDILKGTNAFNIFKAGDGADKLFGRGGNDWLRGEGGNDTLVGGTGGDTLDGGTGLDLADYSDAGSGLLAVLYNAAANTGDAAGDSYIDIEGLVGSAFGDTLAGSNGVDILLGAGGNDYLKAYAGNDTLTGGSGGDTLDGGTGIDFADYSNAGSGLLAVLYNPAGNTGDAAGDSYFDIEGLAGSAFGDTLVGSNSVDILSGAGGNDSLKAYGGDDTLTGGSGGDTLNGGTGIDVADYSNAGSGLLAVLYNPAGNTGDAAGDSYFDIEGLAGSAFGDTLVGSNSVDILSGAGGNDSLKAYGGDDTLTGGSGGDTLNGGTGIDVADYSNAGSGLLAVLYNPAGNTGDAAGDSYFDIEGLAGSAFGDTLVGSNSVDILSGAGGNDSLKAYGGDDTLTGGSGGDTLNGGTGIDVADYSNAGSGLLAVLYNPAGNTGDAAGDSYFDIEGLAGSAFGDTLVGSNSVDVLSGAGGNDSLKAYAGDDTLTGGAGNDTLNGGTGIDVADYSDSGAGLLAVLYNPAANTGDAAGDSYIDIEALSGSAFGDTLVGSNGVDILSGAGGNDSLKAYGGDDTLTGGTGSDTLNGGTGDDRFHFTSGDGGDTIIDFAAGAGSEDVLVLIGMDAAHDSFAEIQAAASQVGPDTMIDLGGGDSLTLLGVTATNLHEDDFLFI